MPARNFAVELDDMIRERGTAALLKRPVDTSLLVTEAGFVQGLNAAKILYEEILQAHLKDDDKR